jgi:hypothetical protein
MASAVVVRQRRVKAAAIESSFWIIPPRRSETAVLYGRSWVDRSTADSSPKQFASGGLRFEEACEDCRSVTTVSGSIVASSEMASDDRRGALLISSVNSATDAGAKCASEGKGPASGKSGVCGAWRTAGGRSRCAHSKTRFTIALARSKRLLSLTPGCRGATRSPSYGIASAPRSTADGRRRRSVPPLSALRRRHAGDREGHRQSHRVGGGARLVTGEGKREGNHESSEVLRQGGRAR